MKTLVIETLQFFEIDVPDDTDAESYLDTLECREICADKILSGVTELKLERVENHDS